MTIYQSGLVSYKNLEDESLPARHLLNISRDHVLSLWVALAKGEFHVIEREAWLPGAFPPITAEEKRKRQEEAERITLSLDRQFYDSLGPERPNTICRHEGCARGMIQFSVFCRPHHFESLRKTKCPFSH
jgi:hypothetical protein